MKSVGMVSDNSLAAVRRWRLGWESVHIVLRAIRNRIESNHK